MVWTSYNIAWERDKQRRLVGCNWQWKLSRAMANLKGASHYQWLIAWEFAYHTARRQCGLSVECTSYRSRQSVQCGGAKMITLIMRLSVGFHHVASRCKFARFRCKYFVLCNTADLIGFWVSQIYSQFIDTFNYKSICKFIMYNWICRSCKWE